MLEQIYSDFTTKLLPQIQEGLVITKDYFTDLFGRYIHYLVIKDAISLGVSFIILLALIFTLKGVYEWVKSYEQKSIWDSNDRYIGLCIHILLIIIALGTTFYYATNLIKDKYIPEIRVYEELKSYTVNS